VAQAEASQQAALVNYQAVIQSAFADVENALVSREKLAQQVEAEARRVKALAEYARLAKLQYDGGYTGYSPCSTPAAALPRRDQLRAEPRPEIQRARQHLQVDGGGWVDRADALAPQPAPDSSPLAAPIPRREAAGSATAPVGAP